MTAKRRTKAHIPKQILDAIERVWPDGVMEIGYDLIEDSYFHELYPRLRRNLSSIKGTSLRYEREADEQRQGEDDWDSDESDWSDNLSIDDRTYSYHLFFICPDDSAMKLRPKSLTKKTRMWKKWSRAKVSSAVSSAFPFSLDLLSWG